MTLRPSQDMTKILLSTTSRFMGEYASDGMLLTHAWPSGHRQAEGNLGLTENPMSRNYYALALETPPFDRAKSVVVPDFTPTGDMLSVYLSILFGKRFDNHGRLESNGRFYLPHVGGSMIPCNASLPFNSHSVRANLKIPLDFAEVQRIKPLLCMQEPDDRFLGFVSSAGRFYLHALQEVEKDAEIAFLDLITCCEILSNFYEYDDKVLLDSTMQNDLRQIAEQVNGGDTISKRIRGRLYQVKRKFTTTLLKLLTPGFFQHREAKEELFALKMGDIEMRIKAAYDLRSRYIHTGLSFGDWVFSGTTYQAEVLLGAPVVKDKDFKQLLMRSPTFLGLERIVRFCLLRFIHLNGCRIDPQLDEPGLLTKMLESDE